MERGDHQCAYAYERGPLFPVRVRTPIRVRSVKPATGGNVRIEVKSDRLGSGVIVVASMAGTPLNAADVEAILPRIFARTADEESAPGFIGNRASHMLHAAGCNHLPEATDREPFKERDVAVAKGYRDCPACYAKLPSVPDYELEYYLGRDVSSRVRALYPISPNEALQHKLDTAGRAVLERWLLPLKGYSYHFYVVESDELNAIACPTGLVYVTKGLMDAVESDAELEAVIAHEVTHVELRHGYRQFRSAQKVGFITAIVGGVMAAAVESKVKSAGTRDLITQTVTILATLSAQIVLAGYSREFESEADGYAAEYLMSGRGLANADPLVRITAKLRYAGFASGTQFAQRPTGFDTHPDLDSRIGGARSAVSAAFDSAEVFNGVDADGNVVATMRFVCQAMFERQKRANPEIEGAGSGWGGITRSSNTESDVEYVLRRAVSVGLEYRAFAILTVVPNAFKPIQLGDVVLSTGVEKFELANAEDPAVSPGEQYGLAFTSHDIKSIVVEQIDGIETPVASGVKHWVRRR